MDTNKILQYTSIFKKIAEEAPDRDSFTNVINQTNQVIQKVLSDNNQYYSKEYFGGKLFNVRIVGGDPSTSIIYISTNVPIQASQGVEKATNVLWFENELSDKVNNLGVKIKVK
jgi:hypothetical protein